MDTGDILLQRQISILEDDTTGTLHDRLMSEGADLVVETLKGMAENRVQAVRRIIRKQPIPAFLPRKTDASNGSETLSI